MSESMNFSQESEDKESKVILRYKINELEQQLAQKDEQIDNYEFELKKMLEDFNYNIELIYERDRDIEGLNTQVGELTEALIEKDREIDELKKKLERLCRVEDENKILRKRVETRAESRQGSTAGDLGKRLEYKSILGDSKVRTVNRSAYIPTNFKPNSVLHRKSSAEPISMLNIDLQERIKALESENDNKDHKSSSLCSSKALSKSDLFDSDISTVREKVKKQEKDISILIKSLQVYKSQPTSASRTQLKTYDDQMKALNADISNLKLSSSKPPDNSTSSTPLVRPRSSFDKRLN